MPEAPDIATAWRNHLEQTPGTRYGNLLLARAAYAQPRLRALFPFSTHGTLHFLRVAPPPWPNELSEPGLPFITEGGALYRVYTAGYEQLLGELSTPEEVAALLVLNLPPSVGLHPAA